ncbi:MAG: phosphodiester glycosidase family protein, partial [Pseudomonadota bacterium]
GTSRKRRGGVGVSVDGNTLFIAVTGNAVNFHSFATLFRDGLGTPNALFTDGPSPAFTTGKMADPTPVPAWARSSQSSNSFHYGTQEKGPERLRLARHR